MRFRQPPSHPRRPLPSRRRAGPPRQVRSRRKRLPKLRGENREIIQTHRAIRRLPLDLSFIGRIPRKEVLQLVFPVATLFLRFVQHMEAELMIFEIVAQLLP